MSRHDALAVAASTTPWVVQYSSDGMVCDGSISVASAPGLDVAFDGTIFDVAGLAARCGVSLEPGASPARVVLDAYRRVGDRCLRGATGRFVLFVADQARNRLLAVRDQMGIYPLFYTATARGLLFSTSIDTLLAQPGVSHDLNRVVLAEHLLHRWIDSNETYFSAVRRVPPGHLLDVHGDASVLRRHWDPGAEGRLTDEDALEQFESVFGRAVERCIGRGRTGIFLSGGFDSVSIAAMATSIARRAGRPAPHALSLAFAGPDCDERFAQRGVAQTLGLTQEFLPIDIGTHGGVLPPALARGANWPVPLLNLWAPAYDRLARHGVHHGCDTILTGNGGDEWLNVTPCLAADLMRHGDLRQLAQLIGVFRRSFQSSTSDVLRSLLWTFGLRRLGASAIDRVAPISWGRHRRRRLVRSTPPWVAPDPAVRREMDARAERALPPVRPGAGGFYEYEMQLAFTHPLVAMEAEEHFEFGRRVGAEMLHPYLDADLVQLLYGMSPRSLMSGGRTKAVVRSTVARRFPDLGFERHRKVDATSFFGRAIQQEGPAAWRHSGGTPALVELGLVSSYDLAPVVDGLFAGEAPRENEVIWNVLNLEAWVRGKVAGPSGAKAEL